MRKKINSGAFTHLTPYQIIGVLIFILISIVNFYYFFYNIRNDGDTSNNKTINKVVIEQKNITPDNYGYGYGYGLFSKPNYSYSNLPNDVLLNPYVPPLKDDRYIINDNIVFGGGYRLPINVRTNVGSVDTNYRQVGILTSVKGDKQKILPLMGRPLFTNRDKWNYYTQDDKNGIKLPIVYKAKSCTTDYGCDEINNRDNVIVKGYNSIFKVEMYDNDTIRYLPFI